MATRWWYGSSRSARIDRAHAAAPGFADDAVRADPQPFGRGRLAGLFYQRSGVGGRLPVEPCFRPLTGLEETLYVLAERRVS